MTVILDLPVEVLRLIFPYLEPADYLNFLATCSSLHQSTFLYDSVYWSGQTRHDFRVPNQPVAAADGVRWFKLYKRMLKETSVYSWGNNEKGCLGHSFRAGGARMHNPRLQFRNPHFGRHSDHIAWPGKMENTESLGIISDLQCGGWSTTTLNNKGVLYSVGQMDGSRYPQNPCLEPTALGFPANVKPHHKMIKQMSAGRSHVLGLSDSGRIYSWHDIREPGLYVRFVAHTLVEDGSRSEGTVRKVVAGWSLSAALLEGIGIVVWTPDAVRDGARAEAVLIMESEVIEYSNYNRRLTQPSDQSRLLAETVGEVLDFVLLDHFVLFSTDLGKLYAARVDWGNTERRISSSVEIQIPIPTSSLSNDANSSFVTSVQGSFRNFAVFTRSGQVLTSDQDRIMHLVDGVFPGATRVFDRIPALQDSGVISVAFGDYHFQALHSSGKITSYGKEPQMCGALGLGGNGNPESRLRGMRNDRNNPQDGVLVKHAYTTGRQVWFEPEKRDWIRWITAGGADPGESAERVRMALGSADTTCQGEVSEWIEQQGRDWDRFAAPSKDDDGLCAYFALSIAAAGWHSAALILKNDDLASRGVPYVWKDHNFPRLRLQSGEEMPGEVTFDEWLHGRPEFKLHEDEWI
ncbi:RCC1/BLIP-II [Dissoconium aciculare CBS 342.82]|uniref:RCC1/BLIP-II n=1 Tax=Dissoconium aciculare CBS 342.82 TaxID=1314786 RepID=A0A6J3LVL7_9PEZI|nr:RCC1/BLIP-II [Dissoconium aciculare CBS 342.82]KAF1819723.1 RCC1/BLIP-II [Dissoconium aciculare CBS 342.82]